MVLPGQLRRCVHQMCIRDRNKDYQTADPITIPQKLAGGEVLFALENNATMALSLIHI